MRQQGKVNLFWIRIHEAGIEETVTELVRDKNFCSSMMLEEIQKTNPGLIDDLLPMSGRCKANILKAKGLKVSDEYRSKPQSWKLQHRFSSEELSEMSRQGAKHTLTLRKERPGAYNNPQSAAYWTSKGFSPEEAEKKKLEFCRENSPRCCEFWLKRGFSEENAKNEIALRAAHGALAALKKTQKPQTEKMIEAFLTQEKIAYLSQVKIASIDPDTRRKRIFVFDFYIPHVNLLVEVNGSYWHADPSVFSADEYVRLPGQTVQASAIWNRDKVKKLTAEIQGYKTVTIWERELREEKWKTNLLTLCRS